MLYVKENDKKDMWFVASNEVSRNNVDGYEIVKIFYSEGHANAYVRNNRKIGEQR